MEDNDINFTNANEKQNAFIKKGFYLFLFLRLPLGADDHNLQGGDKRAKA